MDYTEFKTNRVLKIEKYFAKNLAQFKKFKIVTETRYLGAIGVIQINADWEKIKLLRRKIISKGVFLRPFANVIYLMPPLVISKTQLDKIFSALKQILKD